MARWQKLPTETSEAYAAFHEYLLCPKPRSIDAAWGRATKAQQKRNGKRAYGHWTRWSSQHEWVDRATAYDVNLLKQDELLWEERRRQKKEREWQSAEAIRDIVEEAIPLARQFVRSKTAYVKGTNGAPDREIITMEFDIVGLTTVAEKLQKIQNLVLGDATENLNLSGAALASVIEAEFRRLAGVKVDNPAPAGDDGEGYNDLGPLPGFDDFSTE